MTLAARSLALLVTLCSAAPAQEPVAPEAPVEPYPPSTALAEGVSPEALEGLSQLIQSLVDDDEVVGAELLVIKNGRSILHRAYGWGDREAEQALQPGSVFCVRSMTKPLIGAAILMLVGDDALEFDDPVAEFLPAFDVEGLREITIEQLLTHTGGLPFSQILNLPFDELSGIQDVAALSKAEHLAFEPGSAFSYSDQGTDTLTAVVEVASGMPVADFVTTRVLDPLGMDDSTCVMSEGHPLRPRALVGYAGSRGSWSRFWGPDEPPLFPFFLGSQGLYSTLHDYARFMDFWQRKGRVGRERLVRARYVRQALTPGPYPLGAPTGLPGLRCDYGYLMQLWTAPGEDEDEREVVAYGHTGSDGTHAWVFPEQKAMVLYFTQSRNNTTGLRVEEALGELFLGVPYDPNQAAPPLEQYLGYYWEGPGDLYRAIIRDGDDLALEIMAQGVVPLTYAGEDRWKFRINPSVVIEFDRDEAGAVTGYHIGDHQEFRFEPSPELPDVMQVGEMARAFHRVDLIEDLGPVRISSDLSIPKLDISGEMSTRIAWPDRFRIDALAAGESEQVAYDGEHIWYATSTKARAEISGERAELLRLDNLLARFGDWGRWFAPMQVIQRIERGGRDAWVLRAGDTSAPGTTLYVDVENGSVLRQESLAVVENLGRIGQRVTFGDFRDVSGMQLPYRTEVELANPMIGTIVLTVSKVELEVEVPEGTFELKE